MHKSLTPFELTELHMLKRGYVTYNDGDLKRGVLGIVVGIISLCLAAYYEVGLIIALALPFVAMVLTVVWIDLAGRKINAVRINELESQCAKTEFSA